MEFLYSIFIIFGLSLGIFLISKIWIWLSRRKQRRNFLLFKEANLKKYGEIYPRTANIPFEATKKFNLEPKQRIPLSEKLPVLFPDTKGLEIEQKVKLSNREKFNEAKNKLEYTSAKGEQNNIEIAKKKIEKVVNRNKDFSTDRRANVSLKKEEKNFKRSKDSSYRPEISEHKLKTESKSEQLNTKLNQSFSLLNRSQIYISDQKEQSIRDKIESLTKESKKQRILFITYHISKFKELFSNLLENKKLKLINPWMIKDLKKWEESILDNEIVCFDEFYLDPDGIFFAIVNLFLVNHKLVFGVVNKKEFFSEAAKKFKSLFPDLAVPLSETKEILKGENQSEVANFFN